MSDGLLLTYAAVNKGGSEEGFVLLAAGQFAIPDGMAAIIETGDRHRMTFLGHTLD
ncbi:hypothetical protein MWU53_11960 [Aliiroseovarius sp. S1123]|uniref:hypothetical protein n=1 Tax=unclassified Aliiroseovarius TaxID=2623558 RepID=UPI001FF56922|nr:hypothetical protein [Aliiroseovarius sp. S1123]MCK0171776.1 hypothetical protein [Aliiroseovarius sp. S1123]